MNLEDSFCRSFPDGFPNLFVKDATRIRNRHVAFLASFQNHASIFEQLSVIYQLPRMFIGSFTLVLPYFPTGTAERVNFFPTSHSLHLMSLDAILTHYFIFFLHYLLPLFMAQTRYCCDYRQCKV